MTPEEATMSLDKSEDDLTSRLELARRNSQNQHNKPLPSLQDSKLIEDTIYEGMFIWNPYLVYCDNFAL